MIECCDGNRSLQHVQTRSREPSHQNTFYASSESGNMADLDSFFGEDGIKDRGEIHRKSLGSGRHKPWRVALTDVQACMIWLRMLKCNFMSVITIHVGHYNLFNLNTSWL